MAGRAAPPGSARATRCRAGTSPAPNPRTATTRTAPPTRGLPPAQGGAARPSAPTTGRPAIPAAREETVELEPLTGTTPPAVRPRPRRAARAPPSRPPRPARRDPPPGRRRRPAPSRRCRAARRPTTPRPRCGRWSSGPRPATSAAFGLIYDRYVDTVFRFIYFRVGSRPLAEDLTADTFLRALKRIGSFTWQGRDLGAWLVTIARNLVADHFKSGRYRLEVTTGEVLDADQADRGPEGSPEAAVVDHITNVALLGAVKQLNPEQQECIVLRFLHGFSVAETAHAMGKNEGAIKALQYRAVRALHRLLPEGSSRDAIALLSAERSIDGHRCLPPRHRRTVAFVTPSSRATEQSSGSGGGKRGEGQR